MPEMHPKKTRAGSCATCGRDLVVIAEETVCPECQKVLEVVVTEQWVT